MQSKSLLKQFSKRKRCYYCGAQPPSSKEHAPVKSMFEPFDCDSITVPSCDKHNSQKNLDDRAIMEFAVPKVSHTQEVTLQPFVADPSGELNTSLTHIDQTERIITWTRQLTAALIWSVTGNFDKSINWDEAMIWSPEYVIGKGPSSIADAVSKLTRLRAIKSEINKLAVKWWPGWSSFPKRYPSDIYRFEISFLPSLDLLLCDKSNEIIFRHWFYGAFSIYAWFTASRLTKDMISKIVKTL